MNSGTPRRGPLSPRQHLLNLGISSLVGLATLGATISLPWAAVSFLVTGILIHTLQLGTELGRG
jgi:hypothetical protein